MMMIKIHAEPTDIYFIQVYFPTSNSDDEEVENIYEQLEDLFKITEEKSNVFIIGDFNASVGEQNFTSTIMGKFGLGKQNERGRRLLEFCEQINMIITNNFLKLQKEGDTHGKRLVT